MEVFCTRLGCPRPLNHFTDLDNSAILKTTEQKYCTCCGMPLILQGRYLPVKLLGQGGFGAAFLARDRYTPGMRQCVVKQFKPSGDLSATQLMTAQTLFEREAVALEQLGDRHDQIPDLLAFFELSVPSWQPNKQERFFYLVQEFIDGETLEAELESQGRFSESQVLQLLYAILPVLQFVHEQKAIHRDIKPSNIIRDRHGKLYLLDFGAVKQVTSQAGGAQSASTGIYSMGFAPPEQVSGGEVYPSTDLYALAVTAVNLLTGKKPTDLYDAGRNQWHWRMHVEVSSELASILTKMLSAQPQQRYQSAAEVLTALHQLDRPTPIPSTPPPITRRPSFALWEVLTGAAFSGFEGALLAIALSSLFPSPALGWAIAAVILSGLVFALSRRWIEKVDLLIISVISLVVVVFIPALHANLSVSSILVLAIGGGLMAVALTALFKIIYQLLDRIL
ncbi:serine/threonine protein kinase [Cyanosarcina cf. burmensis CCALA 770]|nr:serine/threonine protein kinase [Cyanosarcina cf. burmensis CCALA 770]